jgi:hypothetical protein
MLNLNLFSRKTLTVVANVVYSVLTRKVRAGGSVIELASQLVRLWSLRKERRANRVRTRKLISTLPKWEVVPYKWSSLTPEDDALHKATPDTVSAVKHPGAR